MTGLTLLKANFPQASLFGAALQQHRGGSRATLKARNAEHGFRYPTFPKYLLLRMIMILWDKKNN